MTTVVLVDDNHADLEIIGRAFGQVGDCEVVAKQSANDALAWISAVEDTSDVIIVTDLNMPGRDGIDLIGDLHELCETPPVTLVISTSARPVDIDRAYSAGANGYHTKPMGFHETTELCQQIANYWFGAAARPRVRSQHHDG